MKNLTLHRLLACEVPELQNCKWFCIDSNPENIDTYFYKDGTVYKVCVKSNKVNLSIHASKWIKLILNFGINVFRLTQYSETVGSWGFSFVGTVGRETVINCFFGVFQNITRFSIFQVIERYYLLHLYPNDVPTVVAMNYVTISNNVYLVFLNGEIITIENGQVGTCHSER